jgi:hypothetical protein
MFLQRVESYLICRSLEVSLPRQTFYNLMVTALKELGGCFFTIYVRNRLKWTDIFQMLPIIIKYFYSPTVRIWDEEDLVLRKLEEASD